jgi:glutamate racemase
MDNRPIGVFDSGLGGLTAVWSLKKILPKEDLIYFGDTSRVPYGGRSNETILKYARQDVRFLRSFDLKAILIACGTVSTAALPALQAENNLPMLGVVEPTCLRAAKVTQNKRVGVIATHASVRTQVYQKNLHAMDPDIQVFGRACPLFVPLVENGRFHKGDVVIETVAREYLEPMKDEGIDTLILGCTHYPLIHEIISEIMGSGVELISAGEESAFAHKRLLASRGLLTAKDQGGDAAYYVSDQAERFEENASWFLQEDLHHGANQINIDQF